MSNHVKGLTSCRPPENEISNENTNESEMDLINRRDAIDAVETKIKKWNAVDGEGYHVGLGLRYTDVIDTLTELPPAQHDLSDFCDRLWKAAYERGKAEAQPERLTDDDFETIRIHLNAYKEKLCNQRRWEEAEEYQRIIDRFMSFASAQADIIHCRDCIHYNAGFECLIEGYGIERDKDWFCGSAERRTDDT